MIKIKVKTNSIEVYRKATYGTTCISYMTSQNIGLGIEGDYNITLKIMKELNSRGFHIGNLIQNYKRIYNFINSDFIKEVKDHEGELMSEKELFQYISYNDNLSFRDILDNADKFNFRMLKFVNSDGYKEFMELYGELR